MTESEIASFKRRWSERTAALARGPAPTIDQQRAAFDAEHGAVPPADNCTIEPINNGTVRGERIVPTGADTSKALLYHHGGGHAFGSSLSHRHLVSRLASAAGVVAYNMDYSLAPENPFPAGLNDAVNAWQYVLGEGFEPDDIVVGGESAGGNLTLALVLKLRELGCALPGAIYLLSPWLDLTQSGEAFDICAPRDPMVSHEALQAMADIYCAGHAPEDPLISPLNGDLVGLPQLLIQVGTDEVLLGDATRLAHRAALAGCDITLRVWPEMIHAWPLFQNELPTKGKAAIAEAGQWIAKRLGTSGK
ncbi:alpha/beta hydrolase [Novosphingobium cyanobacteriorum]|jgi:acetyl esterase/lipase|uniref:Alpha/beta hydrolase n=1 Tax=Novosphingobium cyanobacteriorum TaxID=3024215 RepID=A0ABT6CQS7_9SPHN|nr:alpha/beta hydrolase [Novosphingobium cyanobacteriorum]MDF8335520.1 alpha/beta hydrolase [Novosphingobium cyanobacteriorum]